MFGQVHCRISADSLSYFCFINELTWQQTTFFPCDCLLWKKWMYLWGHVEKNPRESRWKMQLQQRQTQPSTHMWDVWTEAECALLRGKWWDVIKSPCRSRFWSLQTHWEEILLPLWASGGHSPRWRSVCLLTCRPAVTLLYRVIVTIDFPSVLHLLPSPHTVCSTCYRQHLPSETPETGAMGEVFYWSLLETRQI